MRSKLSHPLVRPSSGWRRNLWKQTLWRQPWSPNPVTTIGYGQHEAGAEAWCRRFGTGCRVQPDGLERDDFSSNRHPALSFCLSMISGQTLRVCPEGKPVSTFPDHPLARCRKRSVSPSIPRPLRGREPDEPPLAVIAAPIAQHRCGLVILHPFRHRLDFQPARQIDQRLHEGAIVGRARDVLHEGAIDLHDIDAELAQIPERSVTG